MQTKGPYAGLHNDLEALLRVQAVDNTITWTFATMDWRPLLLNWVYSLVTCGAPPPPAICYSTQSMQQQHHV